MTGTWFITGTDTGVGKTLVSAALLLAARSWGLRAAAIKPVASGCAFDGGVLRSEDAVQLASCADIALDERELNPIALAEPIAPHLAARRAGVVLHAGALAAHVRAVRERHQPDVLLVEGAGGWRVPLGDGGMLADVPRALGCPVILVVGLRLGCLNHALLTAEAIAAAGLPLAGWVANTIDPDMAAIGDNVMTLDEQLPALRLGTVPWLGPDVTPRQACHWLDTTRLWGCRNA